MMQAKATWKAKTLTSLRNNDDIPPWVLIKFKWKKKSLFSPDGDKITFLFSIRDSQTNSTTKTDIKENQDSHKKILYPGFKF